jgi:hypothetical protein
MLSKSSRTYLIRVVILKNLCFGGVRYRSGCRPFRRLEPSELLECLIMGDLKTERYTTLILSEVKKEEYKE